jgi:hypothetical protein
MLSVKFYFVSEGQIMKPGSVTADQAATDRNLSLLLCDDLHSDQYCVLKPDEGKEKKLISIQLILLVIFAHSLTLDSSIVYSNCCYVKLSILAALFLQFFQLFGLDYFFSCLFLIISH